MADYLTSIVDQLLTELFCEFVILTLRRVAMIDVVLHVSEYFRVSTIKEGDATRCYFAIDSCEPSEDVVIHEERVLSHPVPRRVEMTCFERIEDWVETINV